MVCVYLQFNSLRFFLVSNGCFSHTLLLAYPAIAFGNANIWHMNDGTLYETYNICERMTASKKDTRAKFYATFFLIYCEKYGIIEQVENKSLDRNA